MTLPRSDVAVQLVYLVAGVETKLDLQRVTNRLQGTDVDHPLIENGGHVGMVVDLASKAELVVKHLAELEEIFNDGHPGVFEYEVTEALGAWYADNPEATDAEFILKLTDLTTQFFTQDDPVQTT